MPKKHPQRRPCGMFPAGAASRDRIVMPFHVVYRQGVVATNQVFNFVLNGNALGRASTVADSWALFRLKKLRFRIMPVAVTATVGSPPTYVAIGYVTSIPDTNPATFGQVTELTNSTLIAITATNGSIAISDGQTMPSNWVEISGDDLHGPFPWYKSIPGTADATEEAPGQISVAYDAVAPTSYTGTFAIEVEGVVEFKGGVDIVQSGTSLDSELLAKVRADRIERARMVERTKILSILAPPEQNQPAKQADAWIKSFTKV